MKTEEKQLEKEFDNILDQIDGLMRDAQETLRMLEEVRGDDEDPTLVDPGEEDDTEVLPVPTWRFRTMWN